MRYLYDRRITFNSMSNPWPHTPDTSPLPSELADAGFYYTGQGDRVRCFHCGLVLHSWEPTGMPWHAHARYSPSCAYLIVEKGIDWIQLYAGIDPFLRRTSTVLNPVTITGNESPIHVQEDEVESATEDDLLLSDAEDDVILTELSTNLSSLSISVGLSGRPSELLTEVDEFGESELRREFEKARSEQRCKVCLVNRATVVFLPCLHLAGCPICSQQLNECPICRQRAVEVLEVFIT